MVIGTILNEHLIDKLAERCDVIFHLAAAVGVELIVKEEDIQMEKGVILEEINMYEDAPDDLIHDLFMQTILHAHPIGKSTLGTKKSVSGFSRESFLKYRDRLYKPNNVIVSAAGDVKHLDVIKMAESVFGQFNGKKEAVKSFIPQKTINKNCNYVSVWIR